MPPPLGKGGTQWGFSMSKKVVTIRTEYLTMSIFLSLTDLQTIRIDNFQLFDMSKVGDIMGNQNQAIYKSRRGDNGIG
jgi:hypothetical protein